MATTWNPSDKSTNMVLSNGNLTGTGSTNGTTAKVRATDSKIIGKWYAEFTIGTLPASCDVGIGLAPSTYALGTEDYPGFDSNVTVAWYASVSGNNGKIVINSNGAVSGLPGVATNVLRMAVDRDNAKIWMAIGSGNWNNSSSDNPATNAGGLDISTLGQIPLYPLIALWRYGAGTDPSVTANFGDTAFAYSKPSGFTRWSGTDQEMIYATVLLIKAKTDSLTFTVAGQLDANIQYVNDVQVTGDGAGTPWGP